MSNLTALLFSALGAISIAIAAVSLLLVFPKGLSITARLAGVWVPLAVAAMAFSKSLHWMESSSWDFALIGGALGILARFTWHMVQLRNELLEWRSQHPD